MDLDLNALIIRAAFEAGFNAGMGEGLSVEMGEAIGEDEARKQAWDKFVEQIRITKRDELDQPDLVTLLRSNPRPLKY